MELAEWRFKDNRGLNLTGKSIDPEGRGARLANIFDNDPLSHGRISHRLVVDFDHPVSVSEIIYLPRNDANGVYPGNEYAYSRYKTENNVSGKIKSSFLFVFPFFFQEK